jgi:hypothetical protein
MKELNVMSRICFVILMILVAVSFARSQTNNETTNYTVFGGVGVFAPAKPAVQGFVGFAVPVSENGRIWTDCDFSVVKSGGQFTVAGQHLQYVLRTGYAYNKIVYKDWTLISLGAVGPQTDGQFISTAFEYGLGLHKKLRPKLGLMVLFTAETIKDLSTNQYGTNFAPRIALTFGPISPLK